MKQQEKEKLQQAVDKSWPVYRFMMIASALIVLSIAAAFVGGVKWMESITPTERSSSFVGYSQSCWQEGNVLHVVTAKGDTVRLDVRRLEEK